MFRIRNHRFQRLQSAYEKRESMSGCCNRYWPMLLYSNPNRVAELGRIGGKRNRRPSSWTTDLLPPLDSARSAVDEFNRIYDRVSTGAITPKVGHTLVQVINAKGRINHNLLLKSLITELQNDLMIGLPVVE